MLVWSEPASELCKQKIHLELVNFMYFILYLKNKQDLIRLKTFASGGAVCFFTYLTWFYGQIINDWSLVRKAVLLSSLDLSLPGHIPLQ